MLFRVGIKAFSRLAVLGKGDAEGKGMPEERKNQQKKLDEALTKALPADQKMYLKSRFSLTSGMHPHELKF